MDREKDDSRQQLMAIAFVMGFDPGDPRRPWPEFMVALACDGDHRPYRRWLSGESVPSAQTLTAAAERLSRISRETGALFDPKWLQRNAEQIITSSGRSPADFRRACARSVDAPTPAAIAAPCALPSEQTARYTASRYYRPFHVFRLDEADDDLILHGILTVGPDEHHAPGVPQVAYTERFLTYRGFAFAAKDEIFATLRNGDPQSSGCAILIERHTPSNNAFAGIFLGLAHKRQVPAATRCILIRMNADVGVNSESDDERLSGLCEPKSISASHPDFEILAPLLRTSQRRGDSALSRHALSLDGSLVARSLASFRPFAFDHARNEYAG